VSSRTPFRLSWALPAALGAFVLAGCASIPADWGRSQSDALVRERGQTLPRPEDPAAWTRERLAEPLTPAGAVQLALVNQPRLRERAAQLGFSAAEVYDAGRLANPVLSAARLSAGDPAAANAQLTLGITIDFIKLLFLPANTRFAAAQFEAAKLELGSAALTLASDVEAAWYEATGTEQVAQMREAVASGARSAAELAQRFFDAGNISRRELALEQAAASEARLQALAARAAAQSARSELNTLMGLPAEQDRWPLAARLALPLAQEDEPAALLTLAADNRLDIAAARLNAQALANRYGLERRRRWVGNVEIGYEREKDFDGAINHGPTLALELPLFNWGAGRAARARATLDQAEAQLDQLLIESGNRVRQRHAQVLAAKARAETYRTALLPQRDSVMEQLQLELNYMLVGVFEALAAKRAQYDAYEGYLGAVRDYWTARTELARAVGRRLPSADQASTPTLAPEQLLAPKAGVDPHAHH